MSDTRSPQELALHLMSMKEHTMYSSFLCTANDPRVNGNTILVKQVMVTYNHLFPMIKINQRSIYRYLEKLMKNDLIRGSPGPHGLEFDQRHIKGEEMEHDLICDHFRNVVSSICNLVDKEKQEKFIKKILMSKNSLFKFYNYYSFSNGDEQGLYELGELGVATNKRIITFPFSDQESLLQRRIRKSQLKMSRNYIKNLRRFDIIVNNRNSIQLTEKGIEFWYLLKNYYLVLNEMMRSR